MPSKLLVNCRRCGQPLTDPVSVELQFGRDCITKMAQALPLGAKPRQVDMAVDVLYDRRIRYNTKLRAWVVRSSSRTDSYLCTANVCTCPAGQAGYLCYHRIAVHLMEA